LFILKYSNSILSFGLKFLFLISGVLFKLFIYDILLLEFDSLIDSTDGYSTESEQTLNFTLRFDIYNGFYCRDFLLY